MNGLTGAALLSDPDAADRHGGRRLDNHGIAGLAICSRLRCLCLAAWLGARADRSTGVQGFQGWRPAGAGTRWPGAVAAGGWFR
ncbi:MAG TPA: hypothetical protein VKV38_15265 [Trebonia sp.]|jgi:hypothetical protein|nr:hypothetical protein [Trebonia sp.]